MPALSLLMMDSRLKQRLIGAAVLVALAVIFLPMLVKGPAPDGGVSDLGLNVPGAPETAGTIEIPLHVETAPVSALDEAASSTVEGQGATAEPENADTLLPANVASGQYVVHYATFATRTEADEMARQLQARELPAFVEPATFNGRPAVAVRIGPYAGRAEAETVRVRAAQVRADVKPLVLALDADAVPARQTGSPPSAPAGATTAESPRSPSAPAASARPVPAIPAAAASRRPAAPSSPPASPSGTSRAAANPAPPAATGFVVQVGAFSNAASATRLRNRLRAAGIPAFTDTVTTSRGHLTRVNAGPVSSRSEADRLKTQVKSATGTDGIVRTHP